MEHDLSVYDAHTSSLQLKSKGVAGGRRSDRTIDNKKCSTCRVSFRLLFGDNGRTALGGEAHQH